MPNQRVSVDLHTSRLGAGNKTTYSTKIHSTIVAYYRTVLHSVPGSHNIKVAVNQPIHMTLIQILTYRNSGTELKIRIRISIHIRLQCIVLIKILHPSYTFRLFNEKIIY